MRIDINTLDEENDVNIAYGRVGMKKSAQIASSQEENDMKQFKAKTEMPERSARAKFVSVKRKAIRNYEKAKLEVIKAEEEAALVEECPEA